MNADHNAATSFDQLLIWTIRATCLNDNKISDRGNKRHAALPNQQLLIFEVFQIVHGLSSTLPNNMYYRLIFTGDCSCVKNIDNHADLFSRFAPDYVSPVCHLPLNMVQEINLFLSPASENVWSLYRQATSLLPRSF